MHKFSYSAYLAFCNEYYKPREVPGFPKFSITRHGDVYKDGIEIKPFNSNGYLQIALDSRRKTRVIKGVHQIVAMTFIDEYYEGCHVHHKDENKHNNDVSNLEILDPQVHEKLHAKPDKLINYVKKNGSPTKGMKMSKEFCEKCRISALKRSEREKSLGMKHSHGNQFINPDGSRKTIDPIKMEKFKESCRKAALNRKCNK